MSSLQTEFRTYHDALPGLLGSQDGKFVVIKGTELCWFGDNYEAALDWAYEHFGLEGFFIKQVSLGGAVTHFSRDLRPCET